MKKHLLIPATFLIAGLIGLGWFLRSRTEPDTPGARLSIFCAAGLKKPIEATVQAFEKEFGVKVQTQFGGTGSLLSAIQVAKTGDLLIAADDGAVADARKRNIVRETVAIATQTPVIAVATGNPKGIKSLQDLMRPDVRVACANPESASIGRTTQKVFGTKWEQFKQHVTVLKPTVMDISSDLSLGAVDAAIIWDSLIPQFKGIEAVQVPEFAEVKEQASANVLTACKEPVLALKFARYLAAPDKGGAMFANSGYAPVNGDQWAERPALTVFSGGVNRPAVQKTLQEFADREGADLTTVFNGCGILCATMKTMKNAEHPKVPDVYFACDICFVPPVADLFPEAIMLTETDIVLAIPKGNPKNLQTLADLARDGLKIGLCNAEQSTLGFMTRGMLKETGLFDSVMKNVVSQVPTADLLVNQLRTGSLDAAVVYIVNAKGGTADIDTLPILHAGAKAVQPFSVAKASPNRQLAFRLLDFLRANRVRFEEAGFRWRDDAPMKSADIQVPPWLKSDTQL